MLLAGVSFYQLIWWRVIKYGHAVNILSYSLHFRDGPLQNFFWAGEVGGRSTKKYSSRWKLLEKNSCTPINPKKYLCYGLKKIHIRNLITKTNSWSSKIALPFPHNFSNGSSLMFLLHIMCTYHHHMTSGTVGPKGGWVLPYKSDGGARRTF